MDVFMRFYDTCSKKNTKNFLLKGENMGRNSPDCSRAGVEEETTLVCRQRRRTDGATAVRGLDEDRRGG